MVKKKIDTDDDIYKDNGEGYGNGDVEYDDTIADKDLPCISYKG